MTEFPEQTGGGAEGELSLSPQERIRLLEYKVEQLIVLCNGLADNQVKSAEIIRKLALLVAFDKQRAYRSGN